MYIDLHTHSDRSNTRGFLDSTNRVEDLIVYSQQLGHSGIAITDHDTISAHVSALNYVKDLKNPNSNIYKDKNNFTVEDWENYKLILGNEIYLCSRKEIEEDKHYVFYHFILLAKDSIGHKQIRELSTRAWVNNSFTWVNIRTPTYYDDLFEVIENNKGHVIGSTACLGGKLPKLIVEKYEENPSNPDYSCCYNWIKRIDKCFGHGNFFLELQPSNQDAQILVNKVLIKFSKEFDIPYIITTDAHYLCKEDRPIHEAFLKSNEDNGKDREVGDFYATTYLMSEKEIHEYMDNYLSYEDVQKGIENTKLIYDMVEQYDLDHDLVIPYEPNDLTEPDKKLYEYFLEKIPLLEFFFNSSVMSDRHLVREIMNRIVKDKEELANKETYDAINTCLNVIKVTSEKTNAHWSAYLLQTRAFVDTIWESGSLCGPSRGSGGGFTLLYILGITQINPLKEEVPLYYWRFLHEYRASYVDVDVDCEGDKRDLIIQNLQDKYGGYRRVAKVQTVLTFKAKNAILVACRGLGIPVEEAQYLSSFIGAERGIQYTLHQTFYGDEDNNLEPNKEFKDLMTKQYPQVWEVAQKIEGLVSGVGQHAGGVILSPDDIVNYTALMKTSSGDIITQFDLHKLEQTGLIKWDLLAIDALQKEHICLDLLLKDNRIEWKGSLKSTYEAYLGVYKIERNNSEIWKMLNEHKIMSFFQMEKQSGYQAISIGHPESLIDLSALNSVMRLMAPEPGGETPLERYGKFKRNISLWYQEMDKYGLTKKEQEIVAKYAKRNYGLLPNQEDFMMIVQDPDVGGFDLLWADKLRKSIA